MFADESGQSLRPPKARTWSRRGHTPTVLVSSGKGSGRVNLAGMIAVRPGFRTRLIYRAIVNHGRRGERKGFRERDLARMLDGAHQQLAGPIVLVWDNDTAHKDAAMRKLIAARPWLTVFYLPAYTPTLNPVEGVWSALKRSLGEPRPAQHRRLGRVGRNPAASHAVPARRRARRPHRRDRPQPRAAVARTATCLHPRKPEGVGCRG